MVNPVKYVCDDITPKLFVTIRTDFLVRLEDDKVECHWNNEKIIKGQGMKKGKKVPGGEYVKNATVEIVGEKIKAQTNNKGEAKLSIIDLPDGKHLLKITADHSSTEPTGPAIANQLAMPPSRIYRPLEITISTTKGMLSDVTDPYKPENGFVHGRIGNRERFNWTSCHLPLDWKPIWRYRADLDSAKRKERGARDEISLIVVHRTGGRIISGTYHSFSQGYLSGEEAAELNEKEEKKAKKAKKEGKKYKKKEYAANFSCAHYVIDLDGHVIKFARDTRKTNHTGAPAGWDGIKKSINDTSIGIEIVNGDEHKVIKGKKVAIPEPFTEWQYAALVELIKVLQNAYSLQPHRIIGHADGDGALKKKKGTNIRQPGRIEDPGRHFHWEQLEAEGLGMVPDQPERELDPTDYGGFFAEVDGGMLRRDDSDARQRYGGQHRDNIPILDTRPPIAELQGDLAGIGYWVDTNGKYDDRTMWVVDKFQRHFFSGTRRNLIRQGTLKKVDETTARWIKAVRRGIP
jgi:N-acetyl-anhydromuramyl-L-alanine amidase AmpD